LPGEIGNDMGTAQSRRSNSLHDTGWPQKLSGLEAYATLHGALENISFDLNEGELHLPAASFKVARSRTIETPDPPGRRES
jgi:hypothetical protein